MPIQIKRRSTFTLYRFAKKLQGLSPAERGAITAICDAAGHVDGVCTKSISTMARESGHAERKLQYGLHGRKDESGKICWPGIIHRGLIFTEGSVKGGISRHGDGKSHGRTTHWKVDAERFLPLLCESDAAKLREILHPTPPSDSDGKGAQSDDEGCTTEVVRVHNDDGKGAQEGGVRVPIGTQSPKKAVPNNSSPEKGISQSVSSESPTDRMMDLFTEETGGHLKSFVLPEIEKDAERHGSQSVETAFSRMIDETNWACIGDPNQFVLSAKGYRSYLPSIARAEARQSQGKSAVH